MTVFFKVYDAWSKKWYIEKENRWVSDEQQAEIFSDSISSGFFYMAQEPDIDLVRVEPTLEEIEQVKRNYKEKLDDRYAEFSATCNWYLLQRQNKTRRSGQKVTRKKLY